MLTSEQLRDDFKYLFKDEVPALKRLVCMLPRNPLVVNIGAGAGTSGLAILEARPDSYLVTIDIQDASSPFGCLEAERDVIRRAGYSHIQYIRWVQVAEDSVTVGLSWDDYLAGPWSTNNKFARYPDMVFIDGDHSYDHARDDIQIWLRVLKPGGILAVHDYQKDMFDHSADGPHPKPWPGVDMAVDEELLNRYPKILHVDSLIAFKKESL